MADEAIQPLTVKCFEFFENTGMNVATDIEQLFVSSQYLELGYLAARQCFFRHGNLVKVLNESLSPLDSEDFPTFRPNLCHWPKGLDQAGISFGYSDSKLKKRAKTIGLTATEIVEFSMKTKRNLRDLLFHYKERGLDYLEGNDLVPSLCKSPYAASIWFEVHELAHNMGIKSAVTLYPHEQLDYHMIEQTLHRLDSIQRDSKGFLYINFLNVGTIEEQLKLIATSRILTKEIHDFKIEMNRKNILSCQVKLDFGINVVSRMVDSQSEDSPLNQNEFEAIIKRSHKKPVDYVSQSLNEQEAQAFNSMKLYRLKHTDQHDLDHLLEVVSKSPLPAIGASVEQNRLSPNFFNAAALNICKLNISPVAYPDNCVLDFTGTSDMTYDAFLTAVWKHTSSSKGTNWTALGLKGIWSFAQQHNRDVSQVSEDLYRVGITQVASSELESEESITHTEALNLHRKFHQHGIATVAKLELAAPYNGTEDPFWEPFLQRLLGFVDLDKETNLLKGIIVQESQNSFISIKDYLKAVAITRIVAKNQSFIITPIAKLAQGVMQPKIQTKEEFNNIIKLLHSYGGTQLGLRKVPLLDQVEQIQQLLNSHPLCNKIFGI